MFKDEVTSPLKMPKAADQVASVLARIEPLLNDNTICYRIVERAKLLDYMTSIGWTKPETPEECIVEGCSNTKPETEFDSDSSVDYSDEEEEVLLDEICDGMDARDYDPDDIFVSAAHARELQGARADHLSKF